MTTSLERALDRNLGPELADPDVTDICINRPGEVFVKTSMGWQPRIEKPDLTFKECDLIAQYIEGFARRDFHKDKSLLSGELPGGERIYAVRPPTSEDDKIIFALRKPSVVDMTFEQFLSSGTFNMMSAPVPGLLPFQDELLALKKSAEEAMFNGDFVAGQGFLNKFFRLAINKKQNILISGSTGVGKTSLMKALMSLIPAIERLITMEDARELRLPNQPNHVHLRYDNEGKKEGLTAKDLMKAVLRMIPTRIFQGEIRGGEAWEFFINLCSDHPGSITTIHSDSVRGAFAMLMTRMREHPDCGDRYTDAFLMSLLRMQVHIVVQYKYITLPDGRESRFVTEIHYDPENKIVLG